MLPVSLTLFMLLYASKEFVSLESWPRLTFLEKLFFFWMWFRKGFQSSRFRKLQIGTSYPTPISSNASVK